MPPGILPFAFVYEFETRVSQVLHAVRARRLMNRPRLYQEYQATGTSSKDKPSPGLMYDQNTMKESDKKEEDEIEMLRKIRFANGSTYEGSWNTIDMAGVGRYVTPYNVVLEGEFRNGMLHGCGSMYWPRGQVIDSTWNHGKMERQKRYTFADGLIYREDEWDYCKFPDRRFYNCIINGLRPAGKVLKTNNQPTKIIPPFCYDTGFGIFNPDKNCIMSYHNCKKILKIPTTVESNWIKQNCRKGWSEPTGHQEWLREYWQSGAADFATLPHISSEDETENWWQRLTKFARHAPTDMKWKKYKCVKECQLNR